MAEAAQVAVPILLGTIEYQSEIKRLPKLLAQYGEFVIKPARGSGGKGILVIIGRDGHRYIKASGDTLSFEDINRHVSNILGGLHSLGGKPDVAMIESLIHAGSIFNDYSFEGVPDIRMIVFKGFPVMSMLRLATGASDGKANLHQGAIGVGLDWTWKQETACGHCNTISRWIIIPTQGSISNTCECLSGINCSN